LTELAESIQLSPSTDIATAQAGAAFRFRQIVRFSHIFDAGPHSETLRQTITLSGDYIALASIYVSFLRIAAPFAEGFTQVYFRDETNAVVYVVMTRMFAAGSQHDHTHFLPIVFNTTPQTKTFRLYTMDGSWMGAFRFKIIGFFAQL
jgi:hypothetical protein